ncbi:Ribokinase [Streptomyces glaucescens]
MAEGDRWTDPGDLEDAVRTHLRPLAGNLRDAGRFLAGFHRDLADRLGGGPVPPYPVREVLARAATRTAELASADIALPTAPRTAAFTALEEEAAALRSAFDAAPAGFPSGPCHGDLHLSHLLCRPRDDGGWSMSVIDMSTPALGPGEAEWAAQSPVQDLVAVQRALEYFTADEAEDDPLLTAALVARIGEAVTLWSEDPARYRELSERAVTVARQFTWKHCADLHLAAFHRLWRAEQAELPAERALRHGWFDLLKDEEITAEAALAHGDPGAYARLAPVDTPVARRFFRAAWERADFATCERIVDRFPTAVTADDARRLRERCSVTDDGTLVYRLPHAERVQLVIPAPRDPAARALLMSAASVHDRLDEVLHGIVDEGRARFVVATDGADGCHLLVRGEAKVRHFPAVRPERPVVDSNGAGDAFVTAFLHAHLEGRPVEECVLAGSVSGAFACGAAGTHTEFIDLPGLRAACARAVAAE